MRLNSSSCNQGIFSLSFFSRTKTYGQRCSFVHSIEYCSTGWAANENTSLLGKIALHSRCCRVVVVHFVVQVARSILSLSLFLQLADLTSFLTSSSTTLVQTDTHSLRPPGSRADCTQVDAIVIRPGNKNGAASELAQASEFVRCCCNEIATVVGVVVVFIVLCSFYLFPSQVNLSLFFRSFVRSLGRSFVRSFVQFVCMCLCASVMLLLLLFASKRMVFLYFSQVRCSRLTFSPSESLCLCVRVRVFVWLSFSLWTHKCIQTGRQTDGQQDSLARPQ